MTNKELILAGAVAAYTFLAGYATRSWIAESVPAQKQYISVRVDAVNGGYEEDVRGYTNGVPCTLTMHSRMGDVGTPDDPNKVVGAEYVQVTLTLSPPVSQVIRPHK